MPINALPAPPIRSQSQADFSDAADTFLAALPNFVTEANALQVDVNAAGAIASGLSSSLPVAEALAASFTTAGAIATYVNYSARSTNTILAAGDRARFIDCTAAFTQTITAAATLGAGWFCYIANNSGGSVVIDPSAAELINGVATLTLNNGDIYIVICDGTGFNAIKINSNQVNANLSSIAGLVSAADKLPYFTGSGTAAVTTLTSYIRGLLSNPTKLDLLTALSLEKVVNTPQTIANIAQNPACMVAQLSNVNCAGNSGLYYGGCDGYLFRASTATAGTAGRLVFTTVGELRKFAGFESVTMSNGTLSIGQRIESKDSSPLSNKAQTFSFLVYQETGANLTFSLSVDKPTALDNFASVTNISANVAANGSVVVPHGTPTKISYTLPANVANDFTNGMSWTLYINNFSCTSKRIGITEVQVEPALQASTFEYMTYSEYLARALRYLYVFVPDSSGNSIVGMGAYNTTTAYQVLMRVGDMFKTPAISLTGSYADFTFLNTWQAISSMAVQSYANGSVLLGGATTGGTVNAQCILRVAATSKLTFDSRL